MTADVSTLGSTEWHRRRHAAREQVGVRCDSDDDLTEFGLAGVTIDD